LDILHGQFAVGERAFHRARHAALVGCGEIGGIRAHAKTDDFAENLSTARPRPFQRLQH
jgi:hypothetical protein